MSANEVITVIQSVGFPILACVGMAWFVYFMYNKNNEQISKMNEQHRVEFKELQTAIDNNTIVMTKLIDTFKNREENENESE